ncbi:hypothetical protein ACIRU3_38880 [Streptomyces sp. NPDC101151]|uniref:hypothetical protein n=1 Tax=Streptomyces sp. NPDC101151 TaxID=3366115 RepID=UPI003808E3BD
MDHDRYYTETLLDVFIDGDETALAIQSTLGQDALRFVRAAVKHLYTTMNYQAESAQDYQEKVVDVWAGMLNQASTYFHVIQHSLSQMESGLKGDGSGQDLPERDMQALRFSRISYHLLNEILVFGKKRFPSVR